MDAKRATLRDVAAAAGVSRALAGFVLGDDHGKSIPEPTRERVREAARSPETFIFGIQGPQSLFILEKAIGESLRDLGFNRSRPRRWAACPCGCCAPGSPASWAMSCTDRRTTPARPGGRSWRRARSSACTCSASAPSLYSTSRRASRPTAWTTCPRPPSPPAPPASSSAARSAAASSRPAGSPTTFASQASWAGGRAPCRAMTSSAATPSPPTPPPASRTVSPTLRAMISLCVIDRAHVTALPFKPDRRPVDVTSL